MGEPTTVHINVHSAEYTPFLHEPSGEEMFMAPLFQSGDAKTIVFAGRAPTAGCTYRRQPSSSAEQEVFYIVEGRVTWRPDDGEVREWGPDELVLMSAEAVGEIEFSRDLVCVVFMCEDEVVPVDSVSD